MAEPRRILRLQQLILEVLAETIQREVQDPRVGMVTITRVRLAPDLSSARVSWSSLAEEAEQRTQERGLKAALPLLQRRVAESLGTRVTPTLSLNFDPSLAKSQHLNEIFDRLRTERGEPPLPDEVTSEGTAVLADEEADADLAGEDEEEDEDEDEDEDEKI